MEEMMKDDGFCIKVYSPGNLIAREITINGGVHLGGNTDSGGFSGQQISKALMACVGKEKVINAKWKWAGAYWYLRWACNYPVDVQKFCDRIADLKLDIPSDYECCYESIRKICTLSFMEYDARVMDAVKVSRSDQDVFSYCREIALKIAEELGKNSLPRL